MNAASAEADGAIVPPVQAKFNGGAASKAEARLHGRKPIMKPEITTGLAREFFDRVWTPPHDLGAIDELMTEDYTITTAGTVIVGRAAFKEWVAQMQITIGNATNEHLELFSNAAGDRIVSRWITRGTNEGIFGLPADGKPISFTGIAIWRVAKGRLAECWVERAALELYNRLRTRG